MDEIEKRIVQLECLAGQLDLRADNEERSREKGIIQLLTELKDIDQRVRHLEKAVYVGFGAVAVLQIGAAWLMR